MQLRKTYQNLNPGMLCDEIHALVQKVGIKAEEAKLQTYPLPSGATQSRIAMTFKMGGKECGSAHIIESPAGETELILDLQEALVPNEKAALLQEELDFIFGSYELKW